MPTIYPREAKRIAVAALLHVQVPISTIARAMIYAVKRRLESGDPSDSLSSVEAEACKTLLLELPGLICLRTILLRPLRHYDLN